MDEWTGRFLYTPSQSLLAGGGGIKKKRKTRQNKKRKKKERKISKQTKQTKNNPQHNDIYSARSGTERLYFTPKNSLEREITFFLHI